AERAWEELVPGAEARELPVDVDLERVGLHLAVPVARLHREPLLDGDLALEQHRALGELAREILLPRLDLALQLVLPGRDTVGPGGDRERPAPAPVDLERAAPPVVAERTQRLLAPAPLARRPHPDRRAERVVAVLEDR